MKPLIYLFVASSCLTNEVQSQKVDFALSVGSSFGSYKSSFQSESITSKNRVGYIIGLIGQVELSNRLSFQPALNYVQKGGKLKSTGFSDHLILHYFEIPLNIAYAVPIGKIKMIIGGGPSLSFGMYGTEEWRDGGQSDKETIRFGSGSNKDLKTFEAGANFMTGFVSDDGFMVLLNYNAGLTNIANDDLPGVKFRTRYFGLKVGQILFRR
jgi:hypothetical protein